MSDEERSSDVDDDERSAIYQRCRVAIADAGQLGVGLAHDLGNELAVLKLNAQLLLRHPDMTEAMQSHAADLAAHADAAADLLAEVVGSSRDGPPRLVPTDLGALLGRFIPVVRRLLPSSIAIESAIPSAPCIVAVDPMQIRQIVLHLARNAGDAMPDGGVVSLRCEPVGSPRTGARIEVSDTGVGMDDVLLARAFEPFFSTKPPRSSAGLGLSMVRQLVADHGGTVDLHSSPEQGTEVQVWLPA